jgi:hypothetical protein
LHLQFSGIIKREGKTKIFEAMPDLAEDYEGGDDNLVLCSFDTLTASCQEIGGEKKIERIY